VSDLFAYAREQGVECQPTDALVQGDEMLLRLLLDQLIAVMSADFTLEVDRHDGMVYIIYNVKGRSFTPQQLQELFSPQTERLEFLVMRQIVREHDAACGHPGLRLVAENTDAGYRIAFSLLPNT
jgi:hypothetical protein